MRELSDLAEQLRTVRQARRQFLDRWAVESAVIEPALDRVAADVIAAVPLALGGPCARLDRLPPRADKS